MTFQFHIQIQYITKPPVWRRVTVPTQFSFYKFHQVIQAAFGWEDDHLHQFSPKGYNSYPQIGVPDREWENDTQDSKSVKLKDIFNAEGQQFTYIYDFGDDWTHIIKLEKILEEKSTKADVLEGKGACPPEDCGGWPGYENFKEIMKDRKHPEHEEMKEWVGLEEDEEWDPNEFDLEYVRSEVRKV